MNFSRNKRFTVPFQIDQFHGNNKRKKKKKKKKKSLLLSLANGRSILRVRSVVSNVVDLFSRRWH